jgi:glycolate oxidase FAD binding subunit
MGAALQPGSAAELSEAIAGSAGRLEILGSGSKRDLGRPVDCDRQLDLSRLSGISLYEPEELVLSAGAATPLAEIERTLAAHRQMLAFEPPDLAPVYGKPAGAGTLGGVLACNLAGPRRVSAGSARDHFLGALAVNGEGTAFRTGGRVVKNVTGYDLCKLLAGSFGTLAALAEVTIKVLPAPESEQSLALPELDDAHAVAIMCRALGSVAQVSTAAHLPAAAAGAIPGLPPGAVTLLRLEGTAAAVADRLALLRRELGPGCEALAAEGSAAAWRAIRDLAPLRGAADTAIWRLSVPPAEGAAVMAGLAGLGRHYFDWGGGLIWLAVHLDGGPADAGAARIRAAIRPKGGHATLIRAPAALRAAIDVFEPAEPALAALTRRVKASFDPAGRLNPGRMYRGI